MLKAIELENFKAFGARTRFGFAPITLIYGQNSAGKSSVLNALNLLKQTRMSREQGALLLPRAERGLVDLGSFHELLHDHDLTRTLAMRVDVVPSASFARRMRQGESLSGLGFEVGFNRRDNDRDVALAYLQAFADGSRPIVRFEPCDLSPRDTRSMSVYPGLGYWRGNQRVSLRHLKGASCVRVTDDPEFWRVTHDAARAAQKDILRGLGALREEVHGEGGGQLSLFRGDNPRDIDFDSAVAFYSSDFQLADFVARRVAAEKGALVALDGFLPMPSRLLGSERYPEALALRYMRDAPVRRNVLFGAAEFIVDAGRALELALEKLFPLGPFRRAPKRLYIFTGTTPIDVGYAGDLLPDLLYRKRQLLTETNAWLERLEIGYRLKIEPVGSPSNDLFEVRLVDTRRGSKTSVALPDVGFGISQILPFIVQALASEEQILSIEQPEVHIHPKLQADLADLLIAGVQESRRHQFIVETHSEHLVLRLLRRIRETADGTLTDEQQRLRPEQLSVIYLERQEDGPRVHHLRVDERGEFIDRWPQGFFEERAKELF